MKKETDRDPKYEVKEKGLSLIFEQRSKKKWEGSHMDISVKDFQPEGKTNERLDIAIFLAYS